MSHPTSVRTAAPIELDTLRVALTLLALTAPSDATLDDARAMAGVVTILDDQRALRLSEELKEASVVTIGGVEP
jgi:hypothetical protein